MNDGETEATEVARRKTRWESSVRNLRCDFVRNWLWTAIVAILVGCGQHGEGNKSDSPTGPMESSSRDVARPELGHCISVVLTRATSDRHYVPMGAAANEIVGFGVQAIPFLEQECSKQEHSEPTNFRRRIAYEALGRLCAEFELAPVRRLVAARIPDATLALNWCGHTDEVRRVLVECVASGQASADALRQLGDFIAHRDAQEALEAGLSMVSIDETTMDALRELAGHGDPRLRSSFEAASRRVVRVSHRAVVLRGLISCGDRNAVIDACNMLKHVQGEAQDRYDIARLAQSLNALCGDRVFAADCVTNSHQLHEQVAAFVEWWDDVGETLGYDGRRRVWSHALKGSSTCASQWPIGGCEDSRDGDSVRRAKDVLRYVAVAGCSYVADRDSPMSVESMRVAALGRDVLPALVKEIRAHTPWEDTSLSVDMKGLVAGQAITLLAEPRDASWLLALAQEGRLSIMPALRVVSDDVVDAAVAFSLARGFSSSELADLVERRGVRGDARTALISFVARVDCDNEAIEDLEQAIAVFDENQEAR